MNKEKKTVFLISSLALVTSIALGAVFLNSAGVFKTAKADVYTLVIDANNPLSGGDVLTKGGTKIHFDEYGVNENAGEGSLLELASYGNIALQTYISGIKEARVYSETGEGKDFFLGVGATPNSCEFTQPSYNGQCSINLYDGYEAGVFYFSVHNRNQTQLKINKIEIDYTCEDGEAALRKVVDDAIGLSPVITYNGHPFDPYKGYEIDPSKIPENRKLVKTLSEDELPTAPGDYRYGYEVYDTDGDGNIRKLLYTRTNTFKIVGMSLTPPDEKKVLTFHIPDENGKEKLIFKETFDGFDLSQLPAECQKYNWESPYNNFKYIGDEHYYPVFNVIGISPNKEGDGCLPVSTSYSYLERGFEMPEPVMKPGYRFGGWFMNTACTQIFDKNQLHPGNLTLYAKCIETTQQVRPVYYHNEDGTLSNHVDYLYEDDTPIELPVASEVLDTRKINPFRWSLFIDDNYQGIYRQPEDVQDEHMEGDKIKFSDFSSVNGEIHLYATELKLIPYVDYSYDLITQDIEGNHIFQHTNMAHKYQRETDFRVASVAVKQRENGEYHYDADAFSVDRTGQFFCTDEKKAYIYDGGTLRNLTSYGYGNITMKKPLSGILRHEGIRKVGRRAFFNRYGLKGTYFPKNAVEFDTEAYANVTFNKILTLPQKLTKIGDRCFMGAENMDFVCLPRTIKTIGLNAFAYGTYNKDTRVFENFVNRTTPGYEPITFLYEGSEADFNRLDEETKNAVKNNALEIIYNYK